MEKGGIEDLFKKQVPRSLYRSYNATKHVITFYNGSNLFFGHVKTDADLLQIHILKQAKSKYAKLQ